MLRAVGARGDRDLSAGGGRIGFISLAGRVLLGALFGFAFEHPLDTSLSWARGLRQGSRRGGRLRRWRRCLFCCCRAPRHQLRGYYRPDIGSSSTLLLEFLGGSLARAFRTPVGKAIERGIDE